MIIQANLISLPQNQKGEKMYNRLTNDKIEIQVASIGAELSSAKIINDNQEYIWQGLPEFWTGRSPVLFPNVGGIKDGNIAINGTTYPIPNHGIARKRKFVLKENTNDKLVYALRYNDELLKQYPYKFELELVYTLEKNTIHIDYNVYNLDKQTIYFQIGTHPAFSCPINDQLSFDDYYIKFNNTEDNRRFFFNSENLLVSETDEAGISGDQLQLRTNLFNKGALIYKDIKSTSFTLMSDKDSRKVIVEANKFPYLGIWQKEGAPFICIEPWHGISDSDDFTGVFQDKELMIALEKNNSYNCRLSITIEK